MVAPAERAQVRREALTYLSLAVLGSQKRLGLGLKPMLLQAHLPPEMSLGCHDSLE